MAKKSSKRREPRLSEAQRYAPQAALETASVRSASVSGAAGSAEVDLAEEYRYVFTDLKRIGVLALVMLAVLVVLALVIL